MGCERSSDAVMFYSVFNASQCLILVSSSTVVSLLSDGVSQLIIIIIIIIRDSRLSHTIQCVCVCVFLVLPSPPVVSLISPSSASFNGALTRANNSTWSVKKLAGAREAIHTPITAQPDGPMGARPPHAVGGACGSPQPRDHPPLCLALSPEGKFASTETPRLLRKFQQDFEMDHVSWIISLVWFWFWFWTGFTTGEEGSARKNGPKSNERLEGFWCGKLICPLLKNNRAAEEAYGAREHRLPSSKELKSSNMWEEMSGLDEEGNSVRTFQICLTDTSLSHWLRTRFIPRRGASQVYVEIRFTMMECSTMPSSFRTCKETFNLYYYQSDEDTASSTHPAWMENPYSKVHTHTHTHTHVYSAEF
ncbi:Ephrin type-B receptor 4b [Labeo rohita]|uniref:Ephrin type-B receptor 4b n=1 Tax=Labeo rohita TaxID=84645 RepID=A0ABQ8L0I1_LABRO|nr:Ephrin type-B receptor 4b [Labeo rohita]